MLSVLLPNVLYNLHNQIQFSSSLTYDHSCALYYEPQAEKVRRRADWMRWVLSTSAHSSGVTSPRFPDSLSHDTVAPGIESVSLNVRDTRFDYMVGHADAHAAISRTLEERNRIGETGQTSTAGTST